MRGIRQVVKIQKIKDGAWSIEDRIFVEQVKQLLSGSRSSVVVGAMAATIIAITNYSLTDVGIFWPWVACMCLGLASRVGVTWWYDCTKSAVQDIKYWRRLCNLYMACVMWMGFAWGCAGLIFLPQDTSKLSPISAAIFVGLTTGSMTAFSPVLRIYLAFIFLILTPVALNLISRGTGTDLAFGALTLVYGFFLSLYGRAQNRTFTESFALRFQNQELVDNLRAEKESAEALNRSLANEVMERRSAAERLEASEQRFHDIAAAASDWLWETDRYGIIIYVSERFEEVSGVSAKSILGSSFDNLPREWDVRMEPEVAKIYAEALAAHEPFSNVVWSYRDDDGGQHYVRAGGTAYFDRDDGSFAGYRGTGSDITERRRTRREFVEQSRLLRRAEKAARVGHWRWIKGTDDVFWSGEMYQIFGIQEDQFDPSLDRVLDHIHAEDRVRYVDEWRRAARDNVGYEGEVRVLQSNGSVRYLWIESEFELSDAGELAMFGIAKDVTEFKQAEAALIEARDEAERANQAKTEFLSSMSHELRTPMNAVLGFAQLLRADKETQLTGAQDTFVEEILNSGQHMMELVNDVLDLAGIETGHIEIQSEKIEPFQTLKDCLSMVAAVADAHNVRINKSCSSENFQSVIADRRRLRQVFLNLLSNAIKYNRPGGSVDVGCRTQPDGFLRILITDSGKGISAGDRDRIFEPFNRLGAENSSVSGTGVGLTVTRQLVELMSGRIDFQSTLGEGTTFWIDLPLSDGAASNAHGMVS